jgi:aminoglycoside phosphotransferase (APT) family kinase protein
LREVDYRAFGLEGFGNPDNYLGRQVSRWRSQLESYGEYPDWPGPKRIPGAEKVARWLQAHQPGGFEPGIIHGDYHFGNVMYRHDGPELAAIVEWELTTIGDPLLDLGWLLATWPADTGATIESHRVEPGTASRPVRSWSRISGPQPS